MIVTKIKKILISLLSSFLISWSWKYHSLSMSIPTKEFIASEDDLLLSSHMCARFSNLDLSPKISIFSSKVMMLPRFTFWLKVNVALFFQSIRTQLTLRFHTGLTLESSISLVLYWKHNMNWITGLLIKINCKDSLRLWDLWSVIRCCFPYLIYIEWSKNFWRLTKSFLMTLILD